MMAMKVMYGSMILPHTSQKNLSFFSENYYLSQRKMLICAAIWYIKTHIHGQLDW